MLSIQGQNGIEAKILTLPRSHGLGLGSTMMPCPC